MNSNRPPALAAFAIPLLLAPLLPSAAVWAEEPAETPPPVRVLLVTGGCCHDYDTQKGLISEGLAQRAHVEVTVVHQGGNATNSKIPLYESAEWSKGYDVVIHNECFADVKDRAWVDNILKPHREGLPAVVFHCAMHCYRDGRDDWFEFCGVTSRRHGAHYPHEVLNVDAEHPIMRGFPAAWANPAGELYWIEKVWPAAHPLGTAKNREKGNDEVCVWTNQYGKARVFGTTLGHHNETVRDPVFLNLLTRGTLWAADRLREEYLIAPAPRRAPVNHARGKAASASSEETGKKNFARNACDGNPATRWCAANGSAPQWWQVDLGEERKLQGCRLDWENRGIAYRYRVEGSTDGEQWSLLLDHSENREKQPETTFAPQTLRYVRVTFLGTDTGNWGSLWEVELFGEETELIEPQAAAARNDSQRLAEVKVPEGFEATLFAEPPAVNYPVFVAAAPEGTVYVSVDKNGSLDRQPRRGAVHRLRDLDGDGRADEVKLFIPDVDSPRGLVWDHDRLYLLHPPHLSAFLDHDGDGVADEQQILVKNIAFGFADRPADHTSNGVTLGIDGWLYLAIGDFGFLKAEGTDGRTLQLRGGGVARVRPDGTGLELYSRGTRNNLEVALDPLLNGFTRDNTNDGGGWDTRLHHFSGLEEHGYPSLYLNFKEEIVPPLADYGAGSGCGALFLSEPGFPEGYGHALYTADWGRQWIYRHTLTPNGATFNDSQTEFLGLPRVTDLDVDASSHIYAASWKGATFTYAGEEVGYLVRVSPKGYRPDPLPNFERATDAELVALLVGPSHRRRLAAQRALLRRHVSAPTAKLIFERAADARLPLEARVAALFTLKEGLGCVAHESLAVLALDSELRPFAIRALGDRWDQYEGLPVETLLAGLDDEHPRTRLEAVVALARLGDPRHAAAIIPRLADSDPLLRHTAVQALVRLGAYREAFAALDRAGETPAHLRAGALRVLQARHHPEVVQGVLARLERTTEPAARREWLTLLCRLHFREGEWKGESWGTRPDTRGPYYQPAPWEETATIAAALERAFAAATGEEAAFLAAQLGRHRIRLEGALPRLIALASADESLLPAAVGELARGDKIPAEALPLLRRVAEGTDRAAGLRAEAALALLKDGGAESFEGALRALAQLAPTAGGEAEVKQLRGRILAWQTLQPRLESLLALAEQADDPRAPWADAGLLLLASQGKVPVEIRARAEGAVEAGWRDPARRARLLQAAELAEHRAWEDRVRRALADSNPQVAAAAAAVAKSWKLAPGPTPAAGPLLGEIPPAEAIAAALKIPGDPARGEALYLRLNCAKCHTVKEGEPLRGPFLPQVAKTYKREQLAEAILLPSKSIAQGFVTNLFQLEDGKTVTGFITAESAESLTVRDAEGTEMVLPVSTIEARVKQEISVMPEGLAKDLPLEDFAALLAYLESLAPAEK